MSGGHFNYFYGQIRDILGGEMEDPELNALVEDFADLCKDLEWLKSGDDSEETYRKSVRKFKKKWLRGEDVKRLKGIIDEQIQQKKDELYRMIGVVPRKRI